MKKIKIFIEPFLRNRQKRIFSTKLAILPAGFAPRYGNATPQSNHFFVSSLLQLPEIFFQENYLPKIYHRVLTSNAIYYSTEMVHH